jgi:hypothetical protein
VKTKFCGEQEGAGKQDCKSEKIEIFDPVQVPVPI